MVRFSRQRRLAQIDHRAVTKEAEIKGRAFGWGQRLSGKIPTRSAYRRIHHSNPINLKERDAAFRALQESQRQLAEANKALEKLSALDGLTGIANRRRFDQDLKATWYRAIRHSTSLSLIMIDIDFFKLFNDHYGHQGGDECLKQVARTLEKSVTRQTDLVARYGGEEFAVILPETGLRGALELAETMRENIEKLHLEHKASKICDIVSISVGVATAIPEQKSQPETLIAAADQGLYLAKEAGRNQVKFSKIIAG
jgi:two-component system chemotaxis family response regulator WspR